MARHESEIKKEDIVNYTGVPCTDNIVTKSYLGDTNRNDLKSFVVPFKSASVDS